MKLHDYQKYAVRFIEEHPIAALFLDMGLGKTITTLTAIHNLMFNLFAVRKVLIIAPLRVARDTWSAEIEKWEHLKPLRYSVAVGTEEERIAAIKADADIYIINRENIAKMKDGVIIINNSRGQMVVEQDLADALNSGKVAAAGLDVVSTEPIRGDNPLLTAKNCILTPHISWAPRESRQRIMDCTVDNVRAYLQGAPINVVNP